MLQEKHFIMPPGSISSLGLVRINITSDIFAQGFDLSASIILHKQIINTKVYVETG